MSKLLSVKTWAIICLLLVTGLLSGSAILYYKIPRHPCIEISLITEPPISGKLFINGAVNNPGTYNIKPADTITSLLQIAGGVTTNADTNNMALFIPQNGEVEIVQKVNINTAEEWLLEALPGIGATLSERIVEYRNTNGAFTNITELTKVKGINLSIYEKIKLLITTGY